MTEAPKQNRFMTGVVTNSASTVGKSVSLDTPWHLMKPGPGDFLLIAFTLGNTASSPTLSINGGAALALKSESGATQFRVAADANLLMHHQGTHLQVIGATVNSLTGPRIDQIK